MFDSLFQYLEKKRLYFPRFFFLSNDGMLEILAETKDPKRVRIHLKKCFAGIDSMEFNESLEITSMKSLHGEEIAFDAAISTASARGQVEKWLLDLENRMRESVSREMSGTYAAMNDEHFIEWMNAWPAQCVRDKITFLFRSSSFNLIPDFHDFSRLVHRKN